MSAQSGELDTILKVKEFIKVKMIGSLQVSLLFVMIVFAAIPAITIRTSIIRSYESKVVSLRTSGVQNQCTILCNLIDSSNYLTNNENPTVTTELNQLASIYNGRILVMNKGYEIVKDTYNLDDGKTVVSQSAVKCFEGNPATNYDKKNQYIEVAMPIYEGDDRVVQGVLLASVSTQNEEEGLAALRFHTDSVLGTLLLVAMLVGLFVARKVTKPLSNMANELEKSSNTAGFSDLQVHSYGELDTVVKAYNHNAEKFRRIDESRTEFVSNVSHELKTPMASVKVLAESLTSQPDVPVELYREFMEDISQEIDRENQVIEDLLFLVRTDRKSGTLEVQDININDLIERNLQIVRPIAQEANIELVFESLRSVHAEIDERKMASVITNLASNAIKYNRENGWVHVRLDADYQFFYLDVSDNGIGIPSESLLHVFERFYRVDKSHSREIGGTGLGLAITQNVVTMHHGTIEVESEEFVGTTFRVRIPLKYRKESEDIRK